MRVQITLRSGAQIEADVEEFSTGRSPVDRSLTSFKWTTPDGWTRKLHLVELNEIAAIVALSGEDE